MKLSCEGWYTLLCKRLRDEESREQDVPFTFLSALYQGFFHDGYLKSSEGHQVRIPFHLLFIVYLFVWEKCKVINYVENGDVVVAYLIVFLCKFFFSLTFNCSVISLFWIVKFSRNSSV